MGDRNFFEMLRKQWSKGNFVCIGLDSDFKRIPKVAHVSGNESRVGVGNTIVNFNHDIVRATKDIVCAYKINPAFYINHGSEGIEALSRTLVNIRIFARDIPVIFDPKNGDIENTNESYAEAAFDIMRADAITVNPYLGSEALQPFLKQTDKGIFVLCHTSNLGAGEFQDLSVRVSVDEIDYISRHQGIPYSFGTGGCYTSLSNHVAYQVSQRWNKNNNCALVVGATHPNKLESIRKISGDIPILIPGIGTQGGNLEKIVIAGRDSRGLGMIINSSSGIIFASDGKDFAEAAYRETMILNDHVDQYRQKG